MDTGDDMSVFFNSAGERIAMGAEEVIQGATGSDENEPKYQGDQSGDEEESGDEEGSGDEEESCDEEETVEDEDGSDGQ